MQYLSVDNLNTCEVSTGMYHVLLLYSPPSPSVKWEVFHSAPERWNTVEHLEHLPHSRTMWNSMKWVCLDTTCHHLSALGICKLGRCSTALQRGRMLWHVQNTAPFQNALEMPVPDNKTLTAEIKAVSAGGMSL